MQDLRDLTRRISRIFRHASFAKCATFEVCDIPKLDISQNDFDLSWINLSYLEIPKSRRIMGLGGR